MSDAPVRTLPDARWTCRGCGACCRLLALGPLDPAWVAGAGAAAALLPPGAPMVESRSGPGGERLFLARGPSGACVFLDPDLRCRIHAVLGEEAKPACCRVFPLDLVRDAAGATLVVRPTCAGHHRSAFDGDRLDATMGAHLALPHPRRAFAPALVEVLPGAGIPAEAWCAVEPRLLAVAARIDEDPEAAAAALREALARGVGRALPAPDPGVARTALDAVVAALAEAVAPLLEGPPGPGSEVPAHAAACLLALARPPAPLAPDARAWLSVVLRTLLLGKGFEPLGLPAALGLHLVDVAVARRAAERGPEGAVGAAAASSVLVPWWIFTSNRAIGAVLDRLRAPLAALWMNTAVLAICLLGPGCGGAVEDLRFGPSDLVPPVLVVRWTSTVPGSSHVEYGEGDDLDHSTPPDEGGTSHEIAVLGLHAGARYHFRPVTVDGAGVAHTGPVEAFDVPPAPPILDGIRASGEPGEAGWVLLSIMAPDPRLSWVVLVEVSGDVVWWYPADPTLMIPTVKPGRDGLSVLFGQYNNEDAEVVPSIVRVALDGSRRTVTSTPRAHHDFAELPDGRLAWLGMDVRRTAYGDMGERFVAAATVVEGPEGAGPDSPDVRTVFDWFDDWSAAPSPVCPCARHDVLGLGALDWVHANGIVHDEESDDWYLVSRNLDNVIRVDRESRRILWELGGANATLDAGAGPPWDHPHVTQVWDGGLTVFDNGNHRDPPESRIAEYAWDDRTARQVWEFRPRPARRAPFLGDVRKLANGHYLASWTPQGLVTEVTPAGEEVWSLEAGPRVGTGRLHFVRDLYRVE